MVTTRDLRQICTRAQVLRPRTRLICAKTTRIGRLRLSTSLANIRSTLLQTSLICVASLTFPDSKTWRNWASQGSTTQMTTRTSYGSRLLMISQLRPCPRSSRNWEPRFFHWRFRTWRLRRRNCSKNKTELWNSKNLPMSKMKRKTAYLYKRTKRSRARQCRILTQRRAGVTQKQHLKIRKPRTSSSTRRQLGGQKRRCQRV